MSGIQYDMVKENDPYYELVRGDFFANFDSYKEFKYQMDRYFPGIWNCEEISRRENGSRAESLIKCTFNVPNSSLHPFYIYLCQFEGGGRRTMPYEQRIQFREHSKWEPDLNTFKIANNFHDNTNVDGAECYLLGIYKRSESDHDVMFAGIHPNWMFDKCIESASTSPTSFQVKIYPFQKAYKYGLDIYTKDDGQRAVCFKPYKILWYMKNRDKLHLGDLDKINMMLKYCKLDSNLPLQQITYGAPGTGKSHGIKCDTKGHSVIRTTFHPDSDYSTFVGAYKPVMEDVDVKVVPVVLNNGASFDQNAGTYKEKRISYKFVKQAFLKAYLGAWKKYADASDVNQVQPQFLVIEEINRGNCAQIFGDLFQLLDRNDDNKFSTYPIEADADLQKEIDDAFKNEKDGEQANPYKLENNINVEGAVDEYTSNYGATLSEDIQEGRILLLPPNLYIWATMNTSDQSLFPIDSAFKRRWQWKYIKITDAKKEWTIKGADFSCDWWIFLQNINEKIALATSSDDKKLGYFFCKAKDGIINEETFVGKVIFYLWNDVFKDNDLSLFIVNETGREPSFDNFYAEDENGKIVPNSVAIKKFITNVVGEDKITVAEATTIEE